MVSKKSKIGTLQITHFIFPFFLQVGNDSRAAIGNECSFSEETNIKVFKAKNSLQKTNFCM